MEFSLNKVMCLAPFWNVYIGVDGDVTSCCYEWMPKVNGNLLNNSFKEIVEGQIAAEVRKSMNGTDFKYCLKEVCPSLASYRTTGRMGVWFQPAEATKDISTDRLDKSRAVELFLNYDNSCNLACPSCRNELILYKRGNAPKSLETIHARVMEGVDYLLSEGYEVVLNITGSGDPFASPFFWDIIQDENFFNKIGLKLQTNGVLMTPNRMQNKNVLENTLHLQISVDAFLEETYDKVRVNGHFKTLKANIQHLDEMISTKQFKHLRDFKLNFIVQEKNYKEIVDFAKWALSFKNSNHIWYNLICDWRHFPPGAYETAAVWKSDHPKHLDFLNHITDPVLDDPRIDLGNLSPFVKKARELKQGDFTKQNSFCVAPWMHHYRSPTGKIGLCCISDTLDPSLKSKTYEEILNSQEMKDIRVQMMTGDLPKECHACKTPNTNHSFKDNLNQSFEYLLEDIKNKTSPDGHTTMLPSYLDFRFLDCNLACRTCGVEYSSRWYKDYEKMGNMEEHINALGYDNEFKDFAKKEYHRLVEAYDWRRVYFAGGEPLLQKDHLGILEKLAAKENPKEIEIYYNTNLSFSQNYLGRLLAQLSQFKRASLFVSVDSHGKFNDMVRYGSRFNLIESNIEFINQNKAKNIELTIDLTITSFFFFNAIEFSEWIILNKYDLNARVMVGYGFFAHLLRIESLKLSFREKIYRQWMAWYYNQTNENKRILHNLKEVMTKFYNLPELTLNDLPNGSEDRERLMDPDTIHFIHHHMKEYFVYDITAGVCKPEDTTTTENS